MEELTEFDIPGTVKFCCEALRDVAAPRVALQFPDHQLRQAPSVVKALTAALADAPAPGPAARLYVLGDTTFGSCCVDEVAAQHISAHAIVHYGHACMSAPASMPVWYVLPRDPVDVPEVARVVSHALDTAASLSSRHRVLLLWDAGVSHAIPAVLQRVAGGEAAPSVSAVQQGWQVGFKHDIKNLLVPSYTLGVATPAPTASACRGEGASSGCCGAQASSASCCGSGTVSACCESRNSSTCCEPTTSAPPAAAASPFVLKVGGLSLDLSTEKGLVTPGPRSAPGAWVLKAERLVVVHIGASLARRRLVVARFGGAAGLFIVYPTPHGGQGNIGDEALPCAVPPRVVTRLLAQRYRVVEAIRGASVLGIVVGTLGVAKHKEMVAALRQAIAWAGKAAYVMVVGKLTPTKLGNFPECDVFINVSCPEAAVIDQVQGGAEASSGGAGTGINSGLLHVGLRPGLEPAAAATGPVGVGALPGAGDFLAPVATPFEALVGLLGDPDYTPPTPSDEDEEEEEEGEDSDSLFARLFAWHGQLDAEFVPLLSRASAAGMKLGASVAAHGQGVREGEEGLTADGQWTQAGAGGVTEATSSAADTSAAALPARLREGGGVTLSLVSGASGLRGTGLSAASTDAPAPAAPEQALPAATEADAAAGAAPAPSTALMAPPSAASTALSTAFASAAGDYLTTKRQWRGLAYEAPEAGSAEGATTVHAGQTGRAAAGYVAVQQQQQQ